jgi:hypothetical protein
MNQTEAYEMVLHAAGHCYAGQKWTGDFKQLFRAISKVEPRVRRMRVRLDAQRARQKKGQDMNMPPWMKAAIESKS